MAGFFSQTGWEKLFKIKKWKKLEKSLAFWGRMWYLYNRQMFWRILLI